MKLIDYVTNEVLEECPDAQVFRGLFLDSKRGKGDRADLILLHRSGLYLVLLEDRDGRVYGSEELHNWVLKTDDQKTEFFYDPVRRARSAAQKLAKKCKGTGDYIVPVVIFGEDAILEQVGNHPDVDIYNADDFAISLHMRKDDDVVPGAARDAIAKQLKMLEMLSK